LTSDRERPVPLPEVEASSAPRRPTGIGELDRVLGGGIVGGSSVLVAGDPGIGKSTLLLQTSGGLAAAGGSTLYVSGEEPPAQVRLRAERLGISSGRISLLAETDVEAIIDHAKEAGPDLLVVDSVQTLSRADLPSAPGSVAQVRECAAELTMFAKRTGVPVCLIGHVTKTGDIAGPRVLAHVVDAVLSFEGDRYHAYRVLRAVKNRFGATDEIGIFEMKPEGLGEVGSPAGLLLGNGSREGPGSVVVPAVEGTRVLLVEVQALATLAPAPPARRRVTGLDSGHGSRRAAGRGVVGDGARVPGRHGGVRGDRPEGRGPPRGPRPRATVRGREAGLHARPRPTGHRRPEGERPDGGRDDRRRPGLARLAARRDIDLRLRDVAGRRAA
jgi:DNA repair protein RadA/Sms